MAPDLKFCWTRCLFSHLAAFTAQTGTTIKFNPPSGQDTMLKGGVSTSINTRHQCITAMKEYESKSLEASNLDIYHT